MKVLFLSNEYAVGKSDSAYTHRLVQLKSALDRQDFQTRFVALRDLPFSRPILAQPLNLPWLRQIAKDYDVIHAGGDAGYTAAFLQPFTHATIIHDVHGDSVSEAQLKYQQRRKPYTVYLIVQALISAGIAYRGADFFLAVSRPLQQRLIHERHVPADRITLIRNGVDIKAFEQTPVPNTNPFTVCYAGGFAPWQGIDNLCSAFELLPQNGIKLKIVGFTAEHGDLKARIARQLGSRVELVDRVSRDELVSHLAAAHILIIPRFKHRAIEVALPTKFAEYLALGRPVIVCDVDETASMVREQQCGLVSDSSPANLAATIQAAADLTYDQLKEMGQRARRLAEQEFAWEVIGQTYANLLASLKKG